MRRITVEEVLEAYRVTGLVPRRGTYCMTIFGARCGCAVGALGAANSIAVENLSCWAGELYGTEYLAGFLNGFDKEIYVVEESDEILAGYADGQAVAAAVFPQGAT